MYCSILSSKKFLSSASKWLSLEKDLSTSPLDGWAFRTLEYSAGDRFPFPSIISERHFFCKQQRGSLFEKTTRDWRKENWRNWHNVPVNWHNWPKNIKNWLYWPHYTKNWPIRLYWLYWPKKKWLLLMVILCSNKGFLYIIWPNLCVD